MLWIFLGTWDDCNDMHFYESKWALEDALKIFIGFLE